MVKITMKTEVITCNFYCIVSKDSKGRKCRVRLTIVCFFFFGAEDGISLEKENVRVEDLLVGFGKTVRSSVVQSSFWVSTYFNLALQFS